MEKTSPVNHVLACILGNLKKERIDLNKEINVIERFLKSKEIKETIEYKRKGCRPKISDHAVLRYLQRNYDIDLGFIKNEMIPDYVLNIAQKMDFNGIVKHKKLRYVFQNKTLITIIKL